MLNVQKLIVEMHPEEVHLQLLQEFAHEERELRKRKYRKLLEQRYELEQAGEFMKLVKQEIDANVVKSKQLIAKKHNNGYIWLTVNPKKDIKIDRLMTIVKKLSGRAFVDEYMYVFEQRGVDEDTVGNGIHAHVLLKRNLNYKPSKCEKYLRNGCKKIVGNIHNGHQVYIKHIGEEFAADKVKYMLEEKTGEGKDKKQEMDIIFRKNNNIDKFYGEIKLFTPSGEKN